MYIDTHAHLWFADYQTDLDSVIENAKANNVTKMVVPGTDIESSRQAVALAKRYPGVIYAAVGVHPEEILNRKSSDHSSIIARRQGSELWEQAVAIGEIGTDGSTEELKNTMEQQKELFKVQCVLALEQDLPVIIHTRDSLQEALDVLDHLPSMPRGQFHCYSHDENGIKQVLERGFHVSFCGNISWSKRVRRLISNVPDDKLLLETDSPFMVPRDKNGDSVLQTAERSELGDRNEPANVVYLAKIIAEVRNQDLKRIEEMTSENAKRLFRL